MRLVVKGRDKIAVYLILEYSYVFIENISSYGSYEMQTITLLSMNTLIHLNSVSRECINETIYIH